MSSLGEGVTRNGERGALEGKGGERTIGSRQDCFKAVQCTGCVPSAQRSTVCVSYMYL